MQGQDLLNALQFNNHRVADDDIRTIGAVEQHAVLVQRQLDLPRAGQCAPVELVARAPFVDAFQQARAEACAPASPSR